jgi:glycosyltransferase involved in cell wall biosynthesis
MRRRHERGARDRLERDALRVSFITDIMTPYIAPVFEALAVRCDLTVLFGSRTGSRAMAWPLTSSGFRHRVVGGLAISRRADAADIYPNPALLAELARARPDVVISGGFSFPSLYAGAYCRASGARLLIQSDGTSHSEAGIGRGQQLTRSILARVANGAVANSGPAAQRLAELGFQPVFEAPHSADIEGFLEVGRATVARDDETTRVVTVGRLLPAKGVDLLLAAVARARASGAKVALTVVGEGDDEPRLRGIAGALGVPDVEWRGFVEPSELPAQLARADVFAFPTRGDTFGMALLEAAAAALPLVSSPYAGATRDLVEVGETGFVVDPHDTAAFADALVTLANDRALRSRMGRAARALASRRTPATAADGYMRAAAYAAAG